MNPETRKAFEYLRKRGYVYFCDQVWENGHVVNVSATFAEVCPNHMEHVRKTYPNAAIFFTDTESVIAENDKREIAFLHATGRI